MVTKVQISVLLEYVKNNNVKNERIYSIFCMSGTYMQRQVQFLAAAAIVT